MATIRTRTLSGAVLVLAAVASLACGKAEAPAPQARPQAAPASPSSAPAEPPRDLIESAMRNGDQAIRDQRYEDAVEAYQMALMDDRTNARAWDALGFAHWHLGDDAKERGARDEAISHYQQSVQAYREALKINPDDGGVWLHLAATLRSAPSRENLRLAEEAQRRGTALINQQLRQQSAPGPAQPGV